MVLIFLNGALFAQTRKIDSLKHAVKLATNDAKKLSAIIDLLEQADSLPEDTLWQYSLDAKKLANRSKNQQNYSLAVLAQAKAYSRWDNVDSARILIEQELPKYKVTDPESRSIYFKLIQKKIDCVADNSNYKAAMPLLFDVMQKAEFYKDSLVVANCMNTLSAWDYDMDLVPAAIKWEYKALSYTNPADPKFYEILTGIYVNLGDNYRWIKQVDSATYCVNKAIELYSKTQNLAWYAYSLQLLCAVCVAKKDYNNAEQAILKSIQAGELIEGKAPQQNKLMYLANVYERQGKIDRAIKVLNDGLEASKKFSKRSPHSKKGGRTADLEEEIFYNRELANCFRSKGDLKQYAAALERVISGNRALYRANSAEAIASLETKYEVEKKEATIARQKLALTKSGYMFYGSLIFSLLAGIIVWLVFREYRRKQKLKIKILRDEEKRLASQAIADAEENERRRIAADLHDNLGAQLSFIKRNVNFIMDQSEGLSQAEEKKYLGYVNDIAQNAMIDLRETIWVLNKEEVTVQEFTDKLKSYLRQQLLDKDKIRWEFYENIETSWQLLSGEVMHLFRIVQELVSNIVRHSEANRIKIEFNSPAPATYLLIIADNGIGFNVNKKYEGHYGLENIQQRAKEINAALLVESSPENGTKVVLIKGENSAFELYNNTVASVTFEK